MEIFLVFHYILYDAKHLRHKLYTIHLQCQQGGSKRECVSVREPWCQDVWVNTTQDNNDPEQWVSLFSPQIQTQTIWHWPSFNRTTSMLTGRLSYNLIGHAGRRMSPIGWGAHVSVETSEMDEEVDRLHRLRTAPRFVWGLRPCTTLLASNKSWIYFTHTHIHPYLWP